MPDTPPYTHVTCCTLNITRSRFQDISQGHVPMKLFCHVFTIMIDFRLSIFILILYRHAPSFSRRHAFSRQFQYPTPPAVSRKKYTLDMLSMSAYSCFDWSWLFILGYHCRESSNKESISILEARRYSDAEKYFVKIDAASFYGHEEHTMILLHKCRFRPMQYLEWLLSWPDDIRLPTITHRAASARLRRPQ